MTSKRFRGTADVAPFVQFRIGAVKIADIVMLSSGHRWRFMLYTFAEESERQIFESFGEALKELHRLLNSPPPEGFETGVPKS